LLTPTALLTNGYYRTDYSAILSPCQLAITGPELRAVRWTARKGGESGRRVPREATSVLGVTRETSLCFSWAGYPRLKQNWDSIPEQQEKDDPLVLTPS